MYVGSRAAANSFRGIYRRMKGFPALLALSTTALLHLAPTVAAQTNPRLSPTVRAVRKVLPSVVNISTEKMVSPEDDASELDDVADYRARPRSSSFFSLGSGSVIAEEGLIVTNSHVTHRATRIHVKLADGRKLLAREIASEELSVALLRIINLPPNFSPTPIEFAEIDDLHLGESVIAAGNPYGLGSSVTKGILSGIDRNVAYQGELVLSNILQTDAAINPGNSGGPLVNLDGEMIGVTLAVRKSAYGIGFAIPLERVENQLGKWLIPERFGDFSLGLVPAVRKSDDGKIQVYVAEVMRGSPAWESGVAPNSVIVKLNGRPLPGLLSLGKTLWKLREGDAVSITLADGQTHDLTVTTIPETDGRAIAKIKLGLNLQELSPGLAESLGYPFGRGVVISGVLSGNPDIRRGDVLARLGDVPIYGLSDIGRALRDKTYADRLRGTVISVKRKGDNYYLLKKNTTLTVK